MVKSDFYYPIFENIGEPVVSMEMIFNPFYPDHVRWRCKSTRKTIKKRR